MGEWRRHVFCLSLQSNLTLPQIYQIYMDHIKIILPSDEIIDSHHVRLLGDDLVDEEDGSDSKDEWLKCFDTSAVPVDSSSTSVCIPPPECLHLHHLTSGSFRTVPCLLQWQQKHLATVARRQRRAHHLLTTCPSTKKYGLHSEQTDGAWEVPN